MNCALICQDHHTPSTLWCTSEKTASCCAARGSRSRAVGVRPVNRIRRRRLTGMYVCMYSPADLQKLSNCPLMTAAAVDSAGAKLSTHDHERLHTGSAGAHPSRKFSSRAPRAAEAVDSPAPAVDSRASCPPTPPYLSTHENEHLDTCSAGRHRHTKIRTRLCMVAHSTS